MPAMNVNNPREPMVPVFPAPRARERWLLTVACATFSLLGLRAVPVSAQPAEAPVPTAQAVPPLRTATGAAEVVPPAAPALPTAPIPTPEVIPGAPQVPAAGPEMGGHAAAAPAPAHGEAAAVGHSEAAGHGTQAPVAPAAGFPGVGGDAATAPLPPFPGHEGGHAAGHEAGHAAAGHGGEHAGPVIENWFSWDYGPEPGRPFHHPPFFFALLNFAVFLFVLSRLFGKGFKTFLENRHGEVRHALDRARHVQAEAEAQLKQIESRIAGLETEMAELLASYRKQAEAERAAIMKRAEDEAAGLLRDAEAQAKAAIVAARQSLEERAALLAVDLAEKLVRSRVRDDDHRRLTEQFVTQVEGMAVAKPATKESP